MVLGGFDLFFVGFWVSLGFCLVDFGGFRLVMVDFVSGVFGVVYGGI